MGNVISSLNEPVLGTVMSSAGPIGRGVAEGSTVGDDTGAAVASGVDDGDGAGDDGGGDAPAPGRPT
jgi:hypothetical protein